MVPFDMAQINHSRQFSSAMSVGRSPKMTRPLRPRVSSEFRALLLPIESSSFSLLLALVAETMAKLLSSSEASSNSMTLSAKAVWVIESTPLRYFLVTKTYILELVNLLAQSGLLCWVGREDQQILRDDSLCSQEFSQKSADHFSLSS